MTVHDVAAYILRERGRLTAMKLQKLVYYSQAWSLVWDEKPLFEEKIEAWASGPIIPILYEAHRGQFQVGPFWPLGDSDKLSEDQKETVDAVLTYYGDKPGYWLGGLAKLEGPWKQARESLGDYEKSSSEITLASMAEYYSSLL